MNIGIGNDHAGFELKVELIEYLRSKGYTVIDHGCGSAESVDYPDFAHSVAAAIENKEYDLGVLICGSGNGINMTANKHQGVRSALCWNVDIAQLAKQHNNANIIALPARFISSDSAKKIIDAFVTAKFEGGRHERRTDKISC